MDKKLQQSDNSCNDLFLCYYFQNYYHDYIVSFKAVGFSQLDKYQKKATF